MWLILEILRHFLISRFNLHVKKITAGQFSLRPIESMQIVLMKDKQLKRTGINFLQISQQYI